MDDPEVGTIVLHRLADVEGSVISVTSLQAPPDARKAYNKGYQALQKEKLAEASKHFQTAVDLYPKYAAAWYELGRIQEHNHDLEQARQSYTRSVAADAKFLSPNLQLAQLAANAQNWKELVDITDRLIKLDPVDYPVAYYHNAVANLNLARIDAAEKSAREGARLDKPHQYPKLEEVLAMALARKKAYADAGEHMRAYLLLAPGADDVLRAKAQLAEIERLSGKQADAHTGLTAAPPPDKVTQP